MAKTGLLLLALLLGLAGGWAAKASGVAALAAAIEALKPLGALWLNALRMTLVPLVFTLVASSVAELSAKGGGGRMVLTTLITFAVLLALAAALGAFSMLGLLQLWPVTPGALGALAVPGPTSAPALPPLADQIAALIPTNPLASAAQGELAPFTVFTVLFALAIGRAEARLAETAITVLKAGADAMMRLVGWILVVAPLGVFVLALQVGSHTGLQGAGALLQLVTLTAVPPALAIVAAYAIARGAGGVGVLRFAVAAAGPQAVAAGTTSSMASLPALVAAAETRLKLPDAAGGTVLPLAVNLFRFGNVALITGTALFCAAAAGVHPTPVQIALCGLVVILTNIGIAGLPAAAVLYAAEAPAFEAVHAPLALLPLVLATTAVADIVTTVANVTNDLAAAAVATRWAVRN